MTDKLDTSPAALRTLSQDHASLAKWSFSFETILPMEGSDCQHVDETDRLRVALNCSSAMLDAIADEKAAWERELGAIGSRVAAMRAAWLEYIEEYGVEHLGGCPEDDTCECPLVARINAALSAAGDTR